MRLGLRLDNGASKSGLPFPTADLSTYYKTITDNIFAESKKNLPAKFLSRVASFNGTDDYVNLGNDEKLNFDSNTPFTFAASIIPSVVAGSNVIIGKETGTGNYTGYLLEIIDSKLRMIIRRDGSPSYQILVSGSTILQTGIAYSIVVTYDGSLDAGGVHLYINNVEETPTDVVNTLTGSIANANNCAIGSRQGDTAQSLFGGIIDKVAIWNRVITTQEIADYTNDISISKTGLVVLYYLTGQGDYDYDLSDNNLHGTWAGTGSRYDYDLNGSLYANENGYSLWQKSGSPDIQVPFDINGAALSLVAGTNIPTGYTHSYDVLPGGDKHNIYDSLINFNPTGSTDAALDIFDRSNTTIHTAASRASIYYDGTDRTTSSIYHISEIINPVVYDTFFEAAYKDWIFGKVLLDESNNIIRLDEHLAYSVQQVTKLAQILKYCNLTNIYP